MAKGTVHVYASPNLDKIIYWVTVLNYGLIFTVIGGMVLHIGLDFIKKSVPKIKGKHELDFDNLMGREFE